MVDDGRGFVAPVTGVFLVAVFCVFVEDVCWAIRPPRNNVDRVMQLKAEMNGFRMPVWSHVCLKYVTHWLKRWARILDPKKNHPSLAAASYRRMGRPKGRVRSGDDAAGENPQTLE